MARIKIQVHETLPQVIPNPMYLNSPTAPEYVCHCSTTACAIDSTLNYMHPMSDSRYFPDTCMAMGPMHTCSSLLLQMLIPLPTAPAPSSALSLPWAYGLYLN